MTRPPVEPIFDRTPHPFGDGAVAPLVYDAGPAALRQRTVNFAAKRHADMLFVSGLDRATADRFRRAVLATGGSRNALESFIEFRGRAPQLEALLKQSGIVRQ